MLNRDNERDGWKINASAGISRVASRFVASGRISACVRSVAALAAALPILATLSFTSPAHAQCQGPGWLLDDGLPGTNARTSVSTAWDPDGPGPRGSVLAVAGDFTQAGAVSVDGIAVYDPATRRWSSLVSGVRLAAGRGYLNAMTSMSNGDLIVGGAFDSIAGVPARNIARWNGAAWSALGNGVNGQVYDLAALPSGDVVVTGFFSEAGGVGAACIARWDGQAWNPLGTGLTSESGWATGNTVRVTPAGDLIVAGFFTAAGGSPANHIARWDGSAWFPLGQGVSGGEVYTMAVAPDGRIYVGGDFRFAGGQPANRVAVWNGTSWAPLGTGVASMPVFAMTVGPGGDLFIGGWFGSAGGVTARLVARWNGAAWSQAGSGFDRNGATVVDRLTTLPSGELFAVGEIRATGAGLPLRNVAQWSGSDWTQTGLGLASSLSSFGVESDGSLFASGAFPDGTAQGTNQASWSAGRWTPLARETLGEPSFTMLAPGEFVWQRNRVIAGPAQNELRRRVGNQWIRFGDVFYEGTKILTSSGGRVFALGDLRFAGSPQTNGVAQWNGSVWQDLFPGRTLVPDSNSLNSLTVLPGGDLVIAGSFSAVEGVPAQNVARWNGTSWTPMGPGFNNSVTRLLLDSAGAPIAVGAFTASGETPVKFLARWNGSAWTNLGEGLPSAPGSIVALADGQLIASAAISSLNDSQLYRWNGAGWTSLSFPVFGTVRDMKLLPNGELVVRTDNPGMGSRQASAYFARYTFTGIPAVGRQPKAAAFGAGDTVTLSATASPGYQNVSVQWKRNGIAIANGPEGASAGGGTVSGAADTLASPTDGTASTLTIANIQPSDVGDYTATFTNACGSSETVVAKVRCRADFDGSMFVDANDYVLFIDHFVRGCTGAGQSNSGPDASCVTSADVDGSGFIDVDDFVAFVNAFERGC